jgi:hypothetical protein
LERKITTDGVLIYPDGSKYFLKNGECINHAGELIETDSKKNKPDTNTRKI